MGDFFLGIIDHLDVVFSGLLTRALAATLVLLAACLYRVLLPKAPKWSRLLVWGLAGLRLALAAPVIWAALALDCRFAVAPPLLVAFTEFSSPTAAARKRPFRAGAAIFLCALAGTASRLLLQGALGLPLTLAALLAAAAMIAILRSLGMYVPPAGALAILPMLLPAERLPRYPLQIALGTALFLALAIAVFREREEAISR